MGQPGFVYVLSNPAMPGLLKIGMTTKSPVGRAEELATTGVPAPFEVEFALYVTDAAEMERDCHSRFADRRYRGDREFFKVSADDVAIFVLRRLELLDGYSIVTSDEDSSLAEIGLRMNQASHRHLHPVEVASALELLTPDELQMLALRYDAHIDQKRAAREQAGVED